MKRKAAMPLMTILKAAAIIIEPECGRSDMSFNKGLFFRGFSLASDLHSTIKEK